MKEEAIIKKLKEEKEYYGAFGKQFLSNSDIKNLLGDPRKFRKPSPPSAVMILGSYLHTKILEPKKAFPVVDTTSRATNIYKSAIADSGESMMILQREAEEMDFLCDCITQNFEFCDIIYKEGNKYEVPGLTTINGMVWKGKADIVSDDRLIDLKTARSLDDFFRSAIAYNYDSQAWLYEQIFGLPMQFIIVEKKTGLTQRSDCSRKFLMGGKEKVYKAMEVYNKFFAENATEDLSQFYIYKQL